MAVKAVGPMRAVLAAHFQATWNRSAREMGRGGRWALVLAIGLIGLLGGLPAMGVSAFGGYLLGSHFEATTTPLIMGAVLAFGAGMVGLVSGILGGTKVLQWESYQLYPIPLRQVFAAELVAGIGDPLPMLAGVSALSLCIGLSVAHPSLLPLALLLWLQAMLWLLLIQHLMGSLAAELMKRMKVALMVFGAAFWLLSMLPAMLARSGANEAGPSVRAVLTPERLAQLKQIGNAVTAMVSTLPSTHAARGLSDALSGHWFAALLHQIAPAVLLGMALVLVGRQMAREAEPQGQEASPAAAGPEKLWGFASPAAGVAKLYWKTLMGSQLGRFGLLMPVMTAVLIRGPFSQLRGQGMWALPGAFAYLALAGSQMQYNQFGLDGHGIKTLLLLPISPRDILLGKLRGLAMYQGLQAGLMLVLLGALLRPAPLEVLAALCLTGCFFFVQMGLGHWTSCWLPRAMPRSSLQSGSMPMPVVFIGMGTALANSLLFGGTYLLCAGGAPRLLLPVMASLLALCALGYRHLLPVFESYFEQRREKLLEALG